MGNVLAGPWWLHTIRGALLIALGLAAFIWPGITAVAFVFTFGAYAILDGIVAGAAGLTGQEQGWARVGLFALAAVSIIAGITAFTWPVSAALVITMVVGVWAIVQGIITGAAAIAGSRLQTNNRVLLGLMGLLEVVWGGMLLARPAVGALTLVMVAGGFALATGVVQLVMAYEAYQREKRGEVTISKAPAQVHDRIEH